MLGVSKKIKRETDEERQIIYGDGELEDKKLEESQMIRGYTFGAKWFTENVAADLRKKARNSRRLSVFFGVLAFTAILAVMMLTPLKTVEPYVIRVDKNSGFIDIVKPAGKDSDSPEVAEDKHFIMTYVLAHESYNWASHPSNYYFVKTTSSDAVFTPYRNFQLSSKGFAEILGTTQDVKTEINSIVPLPRSNDGKMAKENKARTYQVRYSQTRILADGRPILDTDPINWITTVSINNDNPASTELDQWLNPKGYEVVGWEANQMSGVNTR